MVTSRYAELIEPGKFVIKEENLTHGDDELLIRITHRFPLDDIQTAFETMLNASDGYIKGVVVP